MLWSQRKVLQPEPLKKSNRGGCLTGKHLKEVTCASRRADYLLQWLATRHKEDSKSLGSFGENKAMCQKWKRYPPQVKVCWALPFSCMSHLKHCRCCLYELAHIKWQDKNLSTTATEHCSAAQQHSASATLLWDFGTYLSQRTVQSRFLWPVKTWVTDLQDSYRRTVKVHLQSSPKAWMIKAKEHLLWHRTCNDAVKRKSNPSLVLHHTEMSEGSASTGSHISDACSCQGAAELDSSHAMEATKSLVKVTAPPHHKDVLTFAIPKKGGHIIVVLKGCGEPCWRAEDQHTRAILQPQQYCRPVCTAKWDIAPLTWVRAGLKSHGCSQHASIPTTAWGSFMLFYDFAVYNFPWDEVCKPEATIFYKINWALSYLHNKYWNIITAILGRERLCKNIMQMWWKANKAMLII